VDDRAERSFVWTDGPRERDSGSHATASGAARFAHADRSPRRKRIAARRAAGRGDGNDGLPAAGTHRTIRRRFERGVARRAGRRQRDGQEPVGRNVQRARTGLDQRAASSRAGS
jgi:hypothetical protein